MGCGASLVPVIILPYQTHTLEIGFFDRYALGVKLGKGAFGQVHIAKPSGSNRNSITKEELAVKILDLRDKERPSMLSSPLRKVASTEVSLWAKVAGHANLVGLHEVFYDDAFCYIVMEKCTSSLFAYMRSIDNFNERSLGVILSQIFLGLEHMHAARVVHRDVKPDNFLVGGVDGATVKLCDFGLSAALPSNGMVKGVFGTAPFMCPEIIKGKCCDERADIWSAAVLAYVLLFGAFPYEPKVPNSKAMKQAIVDGKPPAFAPIGPYCGQERSDSAIEFVRALLERSLDKRPFASSALQMPFMVAISHNQHMTETELPSLRPMLQAAKKAGAFELHDLTKESGIDMILNEKQQNSHGVSLPRQIVGKAVACRHMDTEKGCTWQAAPSVISLTSKVWDNSSSIAVPVSANSSLSLPATSVPSGCWSPSGADSGWSQTDSCL